MKKKNRCSECPRSFGSRFALSAHLRFCKKGKSVKKYACSICKKSFPNPFELTKHVKACKAGRPSGKEGKVACPECGDTFPAKGIGSHRRGRHGVAGSSRWTIQARKKNGVPAPKAGVSRERGGSDQKDEFIRKLLEKAAGHRQTAVEHTQKAESLSKMAADLKELF
jgi:DNA-directed RNA polymerase subunit RPC12/RpoP